MITRLRVALLLQAVGLSLPIVGGVLYDLVTIVVPNPCTREPCFPLPLYLSALAVFLFAGPLYWAASAARRAALLKPRQLAWLITVNIYLIVTAIVLQIMWAEPAKYLGLSSWPLLVILVPSAVLSTAMCIERIWHLRMASRREAHG